MPNWCNNRLQIKGTKADILAFVNDGMRIASTMVTSFDTPETNFGKYREVTDLNEIGWEGDGKLPFPHLSAWYPMPKEMIGDNHSNWHSWAIANWGTKWDVNIDDVYNNFTPYDDDEESCIVLDYQTAWCANNEWVRNVGEKYPNLYFELDAYESGNQYEFGCTCLNGIYCECEPDQVWIDDFKFPDEEDE